MADLSLVKSVCMNECPDEQQDDDEIRFLDLPMELLVMILRYLHPSELPWAREVCRVMRNATEMVYGNKETQFNPRLGVYITRYCLPRRSTFGRLGGCKMDWTTMWFKTWTGAVRSAGRTREALEHWTHEHQDKRYTYLPVQLAIRGGHLDTIVVLHEYGRHAREGSIMAAVTYNHWHIVKWLHEHGCTLTRHVCTHAAGNGNLEMLQWARSKGCGWNSRVCTYAAKGGHLDVLKWLRENGCPWNSALCTVAKENVMEWAHSRRGGPLPCAWKECDWYMEHKHE